MGKAVARHVRPDVAGAGLVHVRLALVQRIITRHNPFVIVQALAPSIGDGPSLLRIVAGDGGHRPHVAVAGNFAATVKIIEDAELPRQLVLVGRDLLAVHAKRRVGIAGPEVAKDLIVSPVLFDDVDHVLNTVRAGLEGDGISSPAHEIASQGFVGGLRQRALGFLYAHPGDGAMDHRSDVGMLGARVHRGGRPRGGVGACALAFSAGDE